jgi:hypothetical protein
LSKAVRPPEVPAYPPEAAANHPDPTEPDSTQPLQADPSIGLSRYGLWEQKYEKDIRPRMYGDPLTAKLASVFLNQPDIHVVEDWGCGYGSFKSYLGTHQTYVGVDGSSAAYSDAVADLENYTSTADAIHMRHVLEHNLRWRRILSNAVESFRKRMVLTLFTPLGDRTEIIARYPDFYGTGVTMIDIALGRNELLDCLSDLHIVAEMTAMSNTQYGVETMFVLGRSSDVSTP